MFLTIIIPTFGRPESLEQCLQSISAQASLRSDTEIVVVDDGSPQSAAERNRAVCQRHGAAYCRHDRNRGMAVGRNTGLSRSFGAWVVFIDDDVCVQDDWLERLIGAMKRQPHDVIGIEGKVVPSGSGLWDREVQNLRGGLYLTCHLAFRKDALVRAGGLDPQFEFEGPYCEDHELAARALRHGEIVFEPSIVVTHQPRKIRGGAYLCKSLWRMHSLLSAELYFYRRQPDRYHLFRHARTFWGTYWAILSRHTLTELRRRDKSVLSARPLQSCLLVAGALLEQLWAWAMLPSIITRWLRNEPGILTNAIDRHRSADAWGLMESDVELLRLAPNPVGSVLFRLTRGPVYNVKTVLRQIGLKTARTAPKILIRVDDVFLGASQQVDKICGVLAAMKVPWLAAVKGEDLLDSGSREFTAELRSSGATIALHGFKHTGTFGPFDSEILQMRFTDIERELGKLSSSLSGEELPRVFVAPFNAVAAEQILYLGRHFPFVCGGPESVRFTEGWGGAVALRSGGWYIPSLFPFYSTAREMLRNDIVGLAASCRGIVCLTFHLNAEARDGFRAFRRLLSRLPVTPGSWESLASEHHGCQCYNIDRGLKECTCGYGSRQTSHPIPAGELRGRCGSSRRV